MIWRFWDRSNKSGDCAAIEPLLSLHSDGMASPAEARRVEAHLQDCPNCRKALRWMQATQQVISARPVVSPPPDLRARIARAIAEADPAAAPVARMPVRPTRRPLTLRPALAFGLSVAAIAAVTGGVIWKANQSVPVANTTPSPVPVAQSSPEQRHPGIKRSVLPPVRPYSVANKNLSGNHVTAGVSHAPVVRRPIVKSMPQPERMAAMPQNTDEISAHADRLTPMRGQLKAQTSPTVRPIKTAKPQPTEMPHVAIKTPDEKVTAPALKSPVRPQTPRDNVVARTDNVPVAHNMIPEPAHQIHPSDIRIGSSVIHPDAPPVHEASTTDNLRGIVQRMHEHQTTLTGRNVALSARVFGASFNGPSDSSGTLAAVASSIH